MGAPNGNYYTGYIENAPNLAWKGKIDFVRLMEKQFALPTVVTNDANAAALGEMVEEKNLFPAGQRPPLPDDITAADKDVA